MHKNVFRVVALAAKEGIEVMTAGFCFPQGLIKYLLFNSDIEYFELRNDGEKRRRPFFVFVFWSVLIVGG